VDLVPELKLIIGEQQPVTEHAIFAGHLATTRSRSRARNAPLLFLHDTTTFT
jgi:hypothetical protein